MTHPTLSELLKGLRDCGECEPMDDCHACLKLAYEELEAKVDWQAGMLERAFLLLNRRKGYSNGASNFCRDFKKGPTK